MEVLGKIFPLSFKVKEGSYTSFFICFFIYAAVCFGLEMLSSVAAPIAGLGMALYILYYAVDVYSVIGVVLCVCRLFGVIK